LHPKEMCTAEGHIHYYVQIPAPNNKVNLGMGWGKGREASTIPGCRAGECVRGAGHGVSVLRHALAPLDTRACGKQDKWSGRLCTLAARSASGHNGLVVCMVRVPGTKGGSRQGQTLTATVKRHQEDAPRPRRQQNTHTQHSTTRAFTTTGLQSEPAHKKEKSRPDPTQHNIAQHTEHRHAHATQHTERRHAHQHHQLWCGPRTSMGAGSR
jgi:hypothetical protein